MKKVLSGIISGCLVLGLTTGAWAATNNINFPLDTYKYIVNGQERAMDSAAFIEDGRTYVPFRYLGYSLGAGEEDVYFDQERNVAVIKLNGRTIEATLGSPVLKVDGEDVQMDVAPLLRQGRVYLPARYIAEGAGYDVTFDVVTNSVLLSQEVAQDQAIVYTKEIKQENDTLIVNMKIPVINGLRNTELQETLNQQFLSQALEAQENYQRRAQEDKLTAAAEGYPFRTHSLYKSYEAITTKGVLSLVLLTSDFTGGAHGSNFREIINIDVQNGRLLTLSDLFKDNVDYKQIINPEITKQIISREENEEQFFFKGEEGFKTIADNQSFYIKGDNLVICFNQYDIAPYVSGMPEFPIPISLLKPYLKEDILSLVQ